MTGPLLAAVNEVFMRDFHHYSRYLALAVEVSDEEISVSPNSQAVHMLSVGLNLINNALLGQASGRISSAANLTFIPQVILLDELSLWQIQT